MNLRLHRLVPFTVAMLMAGAASLATTTADLWWQIRFFGHTDTVNGSADPDGDEFTNAEERTGRTDPLDVDDLPDFLSFGASGVLVYSPIHEDYLEGLRIQAQWWGHGGVRYRIEGLDDNGWHTWPGLAGPEIGEDDLIIVDETSVGDESYAFRLVAWDPDSDSDGYSDWQERLAGTDPYDDGSVPSFGLTDGDDDGFSRFVEWLLGQTDTSADDAGDPDGASTLLNQAAGGDDLMIVIPGQGFGLIEIDPVPSTTGPPLRAVSL